MRVCYVGSFSGPTDEGMRNVAESISVQQRAYSEVMKLDPASILLNHRNLKSFRPDIIHYISGPTIASILLLRFAKFLVPDSKTVITATHPWTHGIRLIPRRARPDLVLFQSEKQRQHLDPLFENMAFIPNGVDADRFRPVSKEERNDVRNEYGIDEDDFVVLHVGNLRQGRNIRLLSRIARIQNCKVILIGSTSVSQRSERLCRELREAGVEIIDSFVPRIERLYSASDCYVFPTEESGRAIEIPLSVLEAMACNLPVVTTKYGGLPDIIKPSSNLRFVDNAQDILAEIQDMMKPHVKNMMIDDNRSQILDLSWQKVAERLNNLYDGLKRD